MADIEVRLLKEGTRIDEERDGVKISRACCSAVVLIRADKNNIIVDPGAMGYADEVIKALAECGLSPKDISIIVNTHTHLDHNYNNYLFPEAVIYTPTSVWYSGDGNRVEMFPHPVDLGIPGIKVLDTPGHMEKHISLLVDSGGKRIAIAGDAVRESIIESGKVPTKYPNAKGYMKSMRLVFSKADEIIPGHGRIITGERLRRLREKLGRIS